MNIRLKPHQKIHIQSSADIYQILQPIFRRCSKLDRDREHLWMMTLDSSRTLRKLELLGVGTQRTVLIDPMEVYHRALLRRAAAIVVIHNHPAGNLSPSRADKTATAKLLEASRLLNIELLDHLIISEEGYFSFLDEGVFEKLAPDYDPGLETRKVVLFNSVRAMD